MIRLWNVRVVLQVVFVAVVGMALSGRSSAATIPDNRIFPRPVVLPLPQAVDTVRQPVISLRGTWKFSADPPQNFWRDDVDPGAWSDVAVPASVTRQGLSLPGAGFPQGGGARRGAAPSSTQPNFGYVYKTRLSIPPDFAGNRVFLRFEGVTGLARVWVNAAQVADHYGGYVAWNCDITDQVRPETDVWLTIAVDDSQQQGITNLNSGGILRDIKLIALPQNHINRLNVETDLDSTYTNATLKVWLGMDFHGGNRGQIRLQLTDPQGQPVRIDSARVELTPQQVQTITEISVASPMKWDAEHPNLYTLQASVMEGDKAIQVVSKKFGFREIEVIGNKVLVNGREVKLRGVTRHDTHPLTGRSVTPEQCDQDAKLFKAANVNLVRTSHYPTMEEFLDACDRYGIYVNDETSVAFASGANNADLAPRFLSQIAELIERDRSHPCILMWSLGNESNYGANISKTYDYARLEDPTRPIIFSWSQSIPPDIEWPYNIYSYHYPTVDTDLGKPGVAVFNGAPRRPLPENMPVLHDEFGHVPAYDREEMMRDPGVNNFWGESIKRFWERMFTTEGCLGGTIWAGIDDTPSGARAIQWGLLDPWRRPKPEYWLTKKAYSPIRIEEQPLRVPTSGGTMDIPIKNWFDHTNLNEIKVAWTVGSESGTVTGPNLEPHAAGVIQLPRRGWKSGELLNLRFLSSAGDVIDEFNLPVDPPNLPLPGPQGPAPQIAEDANQIRVSGADFVLTFSKSTGLLSSGTFKNVELLKGGPYFHLIGAQLGEWTLKQITAKTEGNQAVVSIAGGYRATPEQASGRGGRGGPGRGQPPASASAPAPMSIDVRFELHIDGRGLIITQYTLDSFPLTPPPTRVTPWNDTNAGGFEEVGVAYVLTGDVDALSWSRKALWSVYPPDHIGRVSGTAPRTGKGAAAQSLVKPNWPWAEDEKDFSLFGADDAGGRGTNDFRSMKEYILFASVAAANSRIQLRAESDGTDAVRLEVVDPSRPRSEVRLIINNQWNYRQLGLGNYMKPPVIIQTGYTDAVRMRLVSE